MHIYWSFKNVCHLVQEWQTALCIHIDATPKLLELFWSLVQHACSNETTGKYSCEVSNIYGMDTCHSQVVAVTGLSFVLDSCLPASQSSIPRDINETV